MHDRSVTLSNGRDPWVQCVDRTLRGPRNYGRAVLRRMPALVIAGVLSAFAVLLLTGHYVSEGPVLLRLGVDHGVHLGDVFVVLGWAVALAAVTSLLRATGSQDD